MIRYLSVLLWLIATAALARPGADSNYNVVISSGGGEVTPSIIQLLATSANPLGSGQSGNNPKIYIAPTGAGDVLVLFTSGLHGRTTTVTDSAGDTSPTAICSADDGTGNQVSRGYVFIPTTGTTWVTVTWSGSAQPAIDWVLYELNNVGTTDEGHLCSAGLASTAGTVTQSSFTPTTTTNGNLVLNYMALATQGANCNASGYTAGSGYTLGQGDTSSWLNGNGYGYQKATQYQILASGATAPSMAIAGETCSSGNGDPFNAVSLSIPIQTAGIATPTTIHINKVLQLTSTNFGSPTVPATYSYPTPTVGNTRVWMFDSYNTHGLQVGTATSSDGCNFSKVTDATSGVSFFYAQNCSPCPTCTTVFNNTAGAALDNSGAQFYDISNGSASSYQNEGGASLDCSSVTSKANVPSFTPGNNSVGVAIASLLDGIGPVTGLTAPSGVNYTCPTYTGQTDSDYMCLGDGHGYAYYSSNAAQNWTWSITSHAGNTCNGTVAAFK